MLGKQYTPEELKKLQQRAAKAARKFQSAVAANQKQVRADDTRRKVIAGALALEHADKNPGSEFAHVLLRLVDEYARPDDRRLFDFLPPTAPPSPAPDQFDQAAE